MIDRNTAAVGVSHAGFWIRAATADAPQTARRTARTAASVPTVPGGRRVKFGQQLAVSDGPEAVLPPKLQAAVTGFLVEPGSLLVCYSVAQAHSGKNFAILTYLLSKTHSK